MQSAFVVAVTLLVLGGQAPARKAMVSLDPKVLQAAKLQAKGFVPVDVSQEMAALQEGMVHAINIDGPVPGWVTDAMRKEWEQGAAVCRARLGPPPYVRNIKIALCGQEVANALWQRHLERLDANGIVLGGGVSEDPETKQLRVSVFGYRVDERNVRYLKGPVKTQEEGVKLAAELVGKIIAGEGEAAPRELVRQLPAAPVGAPTGPLVAEFKPVEVPAGCAAKLPKKLELGTDLVSRDLDRLWTASVPSGGAPNRACTVTYQYETGELGTTTILVGNATLTCGEAVFARKDHGFGISGLEEKLFRDLVAQALTAWCK